MSDPTAALESLTSAIPYVLWAVYLIGVVALFVVLDEIHKALRRRVGRNDWRSRQ